MNMTQLKQGSLNGLRRQTNECLDAAYNKGYEDGKKEPREIANVEDTNEYQIGYKEGFAYCRDNSELIPELKKEEYTKGYNTAIDDYNMMIEWMHDCEKDFVKFLFEVYGLSSCRCGIYLLYDLICSYDMAEVIGEFQKWQKEEKKAEEEIKVGDEVDVNGELAIVTRINPNDYDVFYLDGITGEPFKTSCKKTGRHFEEISQLLDKLRGEEE